jgi:hypothetical protein
VRRERIRRRFERIGRERCNPPPPIPPYTSCGGEICDAGRWCFICADPTSETPTTECVVPGAQPVMCSGVSLRLTCDDSSDCAAGEQCFVRHGAATMWSECGDQSFSCGGDALCWRLCASDAECPEAGTTCQPYTVQSVGGDLSWDPVGVCR